MTAFAMFELCSPEESHSKETYALVLFLTLFFNNMQSLFTIEKTEKDLYSILNCVDTSSVR